MATAITPLPGFKFGCDPEVFVLDTEGRPVSAAPFFPGSKEKPFPVEKGAVQVDGMAAEFNIDPAENFEEFNDNIVTVMRKMRSYLPKGYTFSDKASVSFALEVFQNATPKEIELGCTPDMNAWTGEMNPPPECLENPFLRTASGHIHIGWTENEDTSSEEHIGNCLDLVKQLDWFLGGWSVRVDQDKERRKLYGKAGACRIKPYGVEYRVLSNFWLSTKDRRLITWNRMNEGINRMSTLYLPDKAKNYSKFIVESINRGDILSEVRKIGNYPVYSMNKNDCYL